MSIMQVCPYSWSQKFKTLPNSHTVGLTYLKLILIGMFLLTPPSLFARGPTGEETNLEHYMKDRHPVSLTSDGNWILHLDENSVLHRTNVHSPKEHQQTGLAIESYDYLRAHDFSGNVNGQQVAYVDAKGCVQVVSFLGAGVQTKTLSGLCTSIHAKSVALSGDGNLLALDGFNRVSNTEVRDIVLFNRANGKIFLRIPSSLETNSGSGVQTLHLRFLDNDKKLLVVQATMGEGYEGPSYGSDIHFAIWDLQNKSLYSYHHIGSTPSLAQENYVWSFNEISGELWTIESPSKGFNEPTNRKFIVWDIANLKDCRPVRKLKLHWSVGKDPIELVSDILPDPRGRWVATRTGIQPNGRKSSAISIFSQHDGKEIQISRKLMSPFPLAASRAGEALIILGEGSHSPELFPVGNLFTTGLGVEEVPWRVTHCLLEDELPGARQLEKSTSTAKMLYSINLDTKPSSNSDSEQVPLKEGCGYKSDDGGYPDSGVYRWGLSNNNELWIDRLHKLERIDLESAHIQQHIATPRSKDVCSLPIYATREFLNWQGNTITKRSFSDRGIGKDRRVFAEKSNSDAWRVQLRKKYVDVIWGQDVNRRAGTNSNGVLLATYDLESGKELRAEFVDDGMGMPEHGSFELPISSLKPEESYWELSLFGSIRARQRSSPDLVSTVLWDGLNAFVAPRVSAIHPVAPKVEDLGSGKAALLQPDRVVVYDLARKRQIAEIAAKSPVHVQWSEPNQLLFIETTSRYLDQYNPWRLTVYRITN